MEKDLLMVIEIFGFEIKAKYKLALKRWSSSKLMEACSNDLIIPIPQICIYLFDLQLSISKHISNNAKVVEISLQSFNLNESEHNNHNDFQHRVEDDPSFKILKIKLT